MGARHSQTLLTLAIIRASRTITQASYDASGKRNWTKKDCLNMVPSTAVGPRWRSHSTSKSVMRAWQAAHWIRLPLRADEGFCCHGIMTMSLLDHSCMIVGPNPSRLLRVSMSWVCHCHSIAVCGNIWPKICPHVEPNSDPNPPHYWLSWSSIVKLMSVYACVCVCVPGRLLERVSSLLSTPTKNKKYWPKKSKNSSVADGVCLYHNHLLEIILCELY